jgi:UDP-N-acetylglucosamine 3-dehydrogenase
MIRTAVIGVGSMGKNHARIYDELSESELVAVTDVDLDIAKSIASRTNTRAYGDYRAMLEREQPDAVSIATPTALHQEIAIRAMEAGAHVLIEKPIADTVEGGHAIINTAQKLDRKLMIGHIVRFNPAIQKLKEKLNEGALGRIYQIASRRVGPFPARIRDVGVVVDLAPHDIDLMRYLTDTDPIRLYAEIERRIHTEHEDLLIGMLRFPGGITGSLEINWLTPTKIREIVALGERGMFRVDDLTQDLYFYENQQANGELWSALKTIKGVSEGSMIRYSLKRYEPLKAELEAFIECISEDKESPVTGEDGLAALRLALALVEAGRSHKVIEFEHVTARA